MRTTKYFFMAALALMTAACSNEDNAIEQQPQMARGIPFTATISTGNSAATRALTENSDGAIVGTWEENDLVALIYKVGNTSFKAEAKVTSVSDVDGKATLSGELRSDAVNGSDVTIIYPASAVDETTLDVKADATILATQDGTLTGNATSLDKTCDVRTGTGKLSITGAEGYKTATVNNGEAGTYVTLTNYYAILKFSIQDIRGENGISAANFKATEFNVTCPNLQLCRKFTPITATGELYIALPHQTSLTEGAYWLNATIGGKAYVGKAKVASTTLLERGSFVSTTVDMATVGDVVLSNGKFAAKGTTTNAVATITYVVDASAAAANNHGLALALADETGGTGTYGDEFKWGDAKTKCTSKTAVPDASWMLPSKTQMENMITGTGGSIADLANLANLQKYYYWTSTLNTEQDSNPAWIIQNVKKEESDEYEWKWGWNNVYNDLNVRACLAF